MDNHLSRPGECRRYPVSDVDVARPKAQIKTFLLFVSLATFAAWYIARAERQRNAVAHFEKHGGVVYFDGGEMIGPLIQTFPVVEKRRPPFFHLSHTATGVEMSFFAFSQIGPERIEKLGSIKELGIVGHDAEFGTQRVQNALPRVRVINLENERSARWRRHYR